ncbi:MAG: hydantoinase/carbamoylase family amidase [Bacillota bacterium]|nr:hydantoinase/carbamoylase family amidase [Bacillota bacterium]
MGTYGTAFLGSQWYVDKLKEKDLERFIDSNNVNIKNAVKILDELNEEVIRCKKKDKNLKYMFELHCEQGPTLENNKKDLGIVEGITGSSSFKVELIGEANHAGTTPMNSRKDPFYLASLISVELNEYVRRQNKYSVGTIGNIKLEPNSYNIIPGKATFTMDIRSLDTDIMKNIICHIENYIKNLSEKSGIEFKITENHLENPVQLSKELVQNLEENCKKRNYNYQVMASGAGHDSIIMSELCDTVMLFVPSKDGRSHCPEEYSKPEDIAKGGDIILDAILKI